MDRTWVHVRGGRIASKVCLLGLVAAACAGRVSGTAGVEVTVSPDEVLLLPLATFGFSAAITPSGSGVTWSVQESASGGAIDQDGLYSAPSTEGAYHVVATSMADKTRSSSAQVTVASLTSLGPDRRTVWAPGVSGGIPNRTTICRTVNPPASGDATQLIQAAIDACPAGQVVQLGAGTFTVGTSGFILVNKGITLRGAGPDRTTLLKSNGAKPGQGTPGPKPAPVVIIGAARFDNLQSRSTNLTADGAKGANSVTVASTAGFSSGQFVLLDELSGADWQTDPVGRGQIWASADFRVVWQRHKPPQGFDDPFPDAAGWFSRPDRPINEVKQIERISGNTLYFTGPLHIGYRTANSAQVSSYGYPFVQNAGLESLKVVGGDDANVRIQWAANCWAKAIDNTQWLGEGFGLTRAFRIEIRDSYIHDAAWAQPGGGGYAISLASGASDVLVENSIVVKANKMMVARSAGAGSVFGYNYVDDGYINTMPTWIEVGLNASHMVGSHHVLFEGNYGFNWDSDQTHGNAIYHTVFRNHLSGVRRSFGDAGSSNAPRRCIGAMAYSYFHSFIGNVLGLPGQMGGWVYEKADIPTPALFKLGWDGVAPYPVDARVAATAIRHGNFDYLNNEVVWDPSFSERTLPASLYLTRRPAFFDAGKGYTWPWVDPVGTTKLYTLPAKARFDAGTPFVQP